MPHIDFSEAFAEKTEPIAGPAKPSLLVEPPISVVESANVEPARSPWSRIGRSEWVNLSCAAVAVIGGLFSAFYFFNGAELFQGALSVPRELLYPRPLMPGGFTSSGSDLSNANERPVGRPEPKTDPSGDPFPHAGGPLRLDRPIYTSGPESGGVPASGPGVSPSTPGVQLPPGLPRLPGVPGGGLPGPGSLVSRLTLLVPGADQLTRALQKAAADLQKKITVTVRHDLARVVGGAPKSVRRIRFVTRTVHASSGRALVRGGARLGHPARPAGSTVSAPSTGLSTVGSGSGITGSGGGVSGFGSGSTSSGLGSTMGSGMGAIGGVGGGVLNGLGGAVGGVGGAVGGIVGGLTGGPHGGGGRR